MALIDTYGDDVIKEWLQNHKVSEGWTPVDGIYVNGDPLVLLKKENAGYKYSVQYRGNGHYFEHADEAYMYMARRCGEEKNNDRDKSKTNNQPPTQELLNRLVAAPSHLSNDGVWLYDRVDSKLVSDLLDYLNDHIKLEGGRRDPM